MPKTQKAQKPAPVTPTGKLRTFDEVLESVSPKDRANLQKHLDALSERATVAATWKALVATLGTHAPHAVQTVGMEAIRFFVQDGTYKLQLFALEDKATEPLRVYVPNVLDAALQAKLLKRTPTDNIYSVGGDAGTTVEMEELDANNAIDPPVHYKFMIGLNRKALRVTLPPSDRPQPALVAFIQRLCELAVGANDAEVARNKAAMEK